ncbi:hypothetical protein [Streptomyces sp. NPDC053069]|uniref:hypothetical protein n=1 Tax=Streptomyces sp. NPDC053069 TaxID=3365695 RepID=UPI0037CCE5EC
MGKNFSSRLAASPRLAYLYGHITPITMILGLLVSAAFLGLMGVSDVAGAITYLGRLTGVLMVVGAGICLLAAVASFDYWGQVHVKFSGAFVLLGAMTVLGHNLMMMSLQIQGREYTPYVFVWITLIAWSIWALWTLLHKKGVWKDIPAPRQFAIGVLASGLIAVGNFAYSQIYLPYSNPENISNRVVFGKPTARAGGGTLLPVKLEVSNIGKVGVSIVNSVYSVVGEYAEKDVLRGQADWMEELTNNGDAAIHQSIGPPSQVLIESGRIVAPDSWLEPGETITEEKIIELDKASPYDAIEASSDVLLTRRDRVTLEYVSMGDSWNDWLQQRERAPDWVTQPAANKDVPFVRYEYRLQPGSGVLRFTRRPKYLTSWWILDAESPYLESTVSSKPGTGANPSDRELSAWVRRYGFVDKPSGYSVCPLTGLPGQ